jgi:chromosome segregation ATPase
MAETPFPSLQGDEFDIEIPIPIPIPEGYALALLSEITTSDEIFISSKTEHQKIMKRKAYGESCENIAKKQKIQLQLEELSGQQLANETEIHRVQCRIEETEKVIRLKQTELREIQNEKLALIQKLYSVKSKIKSARTKLSRM